MNCCSQASILPVSVKITSSYLGSDMSTIMQDLITYKGRIKQLLFVDKQDWIGPKVWAYLAENPTFLVTILYVIISGLGLLYEYFLFEYFEINVLDYSEAADFFLAAFKRPEAFILAVMISGALLYYRALANWTRKRSNIERYFSLLICWPGWFRREILIPLGLALFFYSYISWAGHEAQSLVQTSNTIVSISPRFKPQKEIRVIPIGTTEKFIFGIPFSNKLANIRKLDCFVETLPEIVAIPLTNIAKIEFQNVRERRQPFFKKFFFYWKKMFFLPQYQNKPPCPNKEVSIFP